MPTEHSVTEEKPWGSCPWYSPSGTVNSRMLSYEPGLSRKASLMDYDICGCWHKQTEMLPASLAEVAMPWPWKPQIHSVTYPF